MKYLLVILPLLAPIACHDITFGHRTDGRKIYDERYEASPAIWRQSNNVTINATSDEEISRVAITDLREDKDGDANIVDGGIGEKFVTVTLKSPTALRGYSFQVEVYSGPNIELGEPSETSSDHEKLENKVPKGANEQNGRTEYPRTSRDLKGDEKKLDTTTVNHGVRLFSTRSEFEYPIQHQDIQKTTDPPKRISSNPRNDETSKIIPAFVNVPTTSTIKTTSSGAVSTQSNNYDYIRNKREIPTTSEEPTKFNFSHPRHQQGLPNVDVTLKSNTDILQDKTSKTPPSLINDQITSTSRGTNVDVITTQTHSNDHLKYSKEAETASENHKIHQGETKSNQSNLNQFSQKTDDSFTASKYSQTSDSRDLPSHIKNSRNDQGFTTKISSLKIDSIPHSRVTRQENHDFLQTNQPKSETPGYSLTTQRNSVNNNPRTLAQNESTPTEDYRIAPNIQQNNNSKTLNIGMKDDQVGNVYHPRNLRYTDEMKVQEAKYKSDNSMTVHDGSHTHTTADSKDMPRNVSNNLSNHQDHNSKPIVSLQ